jgi:O-antigen/teichoic acid export membrane protein
VNNTLHKLRRLLLKGDFTSGVALVASGTALAQGLNLLAAPLLTRLYSPTEFGGFAQFSALLSTLAVIAALRFESAIPMPKETSRGGALLVLSLTIVPVVSVVASLGIFLTMPGAVVSPWLIAVALWLTGTFQALNAWVIRSGRYALGSAGKLAQNGIAVTSQLALAGAQSGVGGLIGGYVLGQLGGTSALGWLLWRDRLLPREGTAQSTFEAARCYGSYAFYSSIAALLNSASLYVPIWALSRLFNDQTAGWFALAQRLVQLPTMLIGASIGQVYLGQAARLLQEQREEFPAFFSKTLLSLSQLAVVTMPPLLLLGSWLTPWIFGKDWQATGSYLVLMLPYLMLEFVVSPISMTANLLGLQRWQTMADAIRLGLLVALFVGLNAFKVSSIASIGAFSVLMSACYGGYLYMYWRISR